MSPFNLGSKIGYTSCIAMSLDDQYLYVGARSLGILIFNINDPLNPQFFQQLQLSGQSFSLALSPKQNVIPNTTFDNQYLYYLNSLSVAVFQKQKPSLFNNIPNLFNIQQSQLFQQGAAISKWRCTVSSNNQYLLGAFDADSLCIFKIEVNSYSKTTPSKMQLVYQFSESLEQLVSRNTFRVFQPGEQIPLGFSVENIQFSKGEKYIYFTAQQQDKSIIAYKFSVNISPQGQYSFQYVKGLKYDQVYYSEQFNISEDEEHAVMSYDVGILLVDMVKFEVISMYTNEGVIGTCCGAVLSHDKKHVLAVVRNVGLFIYDTLDMSNPKLVNQWRTNGGETLLRSKTDQVIYLLDGFNGLILIDSTKLPEIVVIGKYVSPGWTNYISFTPDEKYGIISTMDAGTLTLIDLNDKSNLRVIMKSTIQSQESLTTCIDQTGMSFLYSTNERGLRLYNLQSQVQIHVERQVLSSLTQQYSLISEKDPFLIGLEYLVRFVLLFRKPNQIISQIYYYKDLVLQSLPSWIVVNRSSQGNNNLQTMLQLNIPKECLDSETQTKNYLIIVIQTCFQLDEESFIYESSDLTTTSSESHSIFNFLKQNGFIDGINCATNFFDSTSQLFLDLSQVFTGTNIDPERLIKIQSYVTETFKRTIVYNQFIFEVMSSLQFNQSQTSSMIQAVQNQLSVSFTFQENSQYMFVKKTYPNLAMYFNDQLTVMKLEGELKYVNLALSNGILYFNKNNNQTSNNSQEIQLLIVDNFNHNLNLSFQVESQTKFLKQKSDIVNQKNIQKQVNKQGVDLTIEQNFLIQFDLDSFVDPDQIPLTFQFYQQMSGQYILLSSDFFVKCDNVNLRLVGDPPSSYLFEKVYLRIEVTNGYQIVHEDFYLNINTVPFTYVLNILIKVLGPIAFAFGLYKKRASFMNLYYKSDTMYSTETAYVNQIYRKKISILDQDYEIANLFFQKFIKSISKNINFSNQQQGLNRQSKSILTQQNKSEGIIFDQQKSMQNPQSILQGEVEIQNTPKSIQFIEGITLNKQSDKQNEKQLENNNQTTQMEQDNQNNRMKQNNLINSSLNIQKTQNEPIKTKKYSSFKKLFTQTNNSQQQLKQNEKKSSRNIFGKQQSKFFNDYEKKTNIQKYCQIQAEDGTFQMDTLFSFMIESKLTIKYDLLEYKIEDFILDLQDENSRFYRCLKVNVLRYLLEKEPFTLNFYQYLKEYSIQEQNNRYIDWYKQYVQVIATSDLDEFGVPYPFSNTKLKEEEIYNVLKYLEVIPENNPEQSHYELSYLNSLGINSYLLKEVLFADALGLNFVSSKNIIKCSGESLHLEKNQVISVEAFEKIQDGVCLSLRKLFNLQYKSMPISKYISLPSWMTYDFKNGVIILEGTPSKSDVNDILIRIYDQTRFVSYQFHLKVEEEEKTINQNEQNKTLKKQVKDNNLILKQTSQSLDKNMVSIDLNQINAIKQQQQKQKPILEEFSIQNSQIQSFNKVKIESDENQDEVEDKNYQGIKSMTEYDFNLNSPPIFAHTPSYSRNNPPSFLNANNKLLFNLLDREEIKQAKSVFDQ